jgi:glycine hydroxymethyltransferase
MILCREEHRKAINRAVFPGVQGGPHCHTTAAKAVALEEASKPEFRVYAQQIVKNAKKLAEHLLEKGHTLVSGGTDNHLVLLDLTSTGISGRVAAIALNKCGIELNGNAIPFDKRKPFDPSGVRMGLASLTSRGLGEGEMATVADMLDEGIREAAAREGEIDEGVAAGLKARVKEFLQPFPAPGL